MGRAERLASVVEDRLGVGGAGVHWAAQHWRFYPSDFQYRTHHIDRYGLDRLPEGNRIQDWPVTYEDVEPYYTDTKEFDLGPAGRRAAANDGYKRMLLTSLVRPMNLAGPRETP